MAQKGLLTPSNIDLYGQPEVKNKDGTTSTVRSFSVNIDNREVLLPTVTTDGRIISEDEAVNDYRKTGKHLGIFDTPENATSFASQLHEDYAAGKYRKRPAMAQQTDSTWKPPDYAVADWKPPSYASPVEEEESSGPGIFERVGNAASEFMQKNPKIRELGERFLTGTSPEYEEMLRSKGVSQVLGTPESEGSILPRSESQPESWWGGFAQSIYNDMIRPLGSPSGVVGSSEPRVPLARAARPAAQVRQSFDTESLGDVVPPKALPRGRYEVSPEGVVGGATPTDVPIRSARERVGSRRDPLARAMGVEEPNIPLPDIEIRPVRTDAPIVPPVREVPAEVAPETKTLADQIFPTAKKTLPRTAAEKEATGNVVPERRTIIQRGAHGPVTVVFENANDKELFSAVGRSRRQMSGNLTGRDPDWKGLAAKYNTDSRGIGKLAIEFRNRVLQATKGLEEDSVVRAGSAIEKAPEIESGISEQGGQILAPVRQAIPAEQGTPRLAGLENHGDGVLYVEFDRSVPVTPEAIKSMFPDKNINVTEFHSQTEPSNIQRFRIDALDQTGTNSPGVGNEIESAIGGSFREWDKPPGIVEMQGGFGVKPPKLKKPHKGPGGAAVDVLYNALEQAKPLRGKQEDIYSAERSRRFGAFSGVKTSGVAGAKERLSKLRGEHEKVNVSPIQIPKKEVDALFNTIMSTKKITPGEQAHAIQAMFKLIEGGPVPQTNELAVLDTIFGGGFGDKILELHGGLGGVGIKLAKSANTMKAMMSSMDLSAPLRQGLPMALRKEYYSAFGNMFKYAVSNKKFSDAMDALVDRPNYQIGRESGLFLADTGTLQHGEEAFLNSYIHDLSRAGKVGKLLTTPFRASERAYVGFLNKLRADVFDNMLNDAVAYGHNPQDVSHAIAKFVNTATGRGSLGKLEQSATLLNSLLFSPRLMASRVQMLTNPNLYMNLPKGQRIEGIKALLAVGAAGGLVSGLIADRLGGKTSLDPLSSDFGKARFGNDVVDPYGGFQQYIVLGARLGTLLSGGKINAARGAFESTPATVAENFMANKLSPAASLVYEYAKTRRDREGKLIGRFGREFNTQDEISQRFVPIFVQDLNDLIKEDTEVQKMLGLTPAAFFGMGTQTYPEPGTSSTARQSRFRRFSRFSGS